MKNFPALCIIEISSIATGIYCTDIMLKSAPITVLRSGTVHPGKYLILIGGTVASVDEAYRFGLKAAGTNIIDHVFLPDIHEEVVTALLGGKHTCSDEAIGVFETKTACAIINAADFAIKVTDIDLVEMRISDDLGGNAFAIYSGKIEEVQAALERSEKTMTDHGNLINSTLIARPDTDLTGQISESTLYEKNGLKILDDGEI